MGRLVASFYIHCYLSPHLHVRTRTNRLSTIMALVVLELLSLRGLRQPTSQRRLGSVDDHVWSVITVAPLVHAYCVFRTRCRGHCLGLLAIRD
nr:putative integron gene cassette protein [uncultured bacterium]